MARGLGQTHDLLLGPGWNNFVLDLLTLKLDPTGGSPERWLPAPHLWVVALYTPYRSDPYHPRNRGTHLKVYACKGGNECPRDSLWLLVPTPVQQARLPPHCASVLLSWLFTGEPRLTGSRSLLQQSLAPFSLPAGALGLCSPGGPQPQYSHPPRPHKQAPFSV